VNHLNFGGHQPYLWNGWSYSGKILYTDGYIKSQHTDKMTLKGGVVMVTWRTLNFILGPQWYRSLNGLRWNRQILQTGRMCQILLYGWQTTPKRGVVRITWPIFNFYAYKHISRTAEARVAKFCMQVE